MGIKIKKPKIKIPTVKAVTRAITDTGKQIVKQPIKGIARVAMAPAAAVAQATGGSKWAQKLLDDPTLNKYTLGLSGDYAGFQRATMQVGQGKRLQKEDLNDSLRLGAKVGAALVAGPALMGTSGATKLATYSAAQQLQAGNLKGAAETLAGAGFDTPDWLPQLPNIPQPIADIGRDFLTRRPASIEGGNGGFNQPVYVNSPSGENSAGLTSNPLILAAAAFAGVALILKLRK